MRTSSRSPSATVPVFIYLPHEIWVYISDEDSDTLICKGSKANSRNRAVHPYQKKEVRMNWFLHFMSHGRQDISLMDLLHRLMLTMLRISEQTMMTERLGDALISIFIFITCSGHLVSEQRRLDLSPLV